MAELTLEEYNSRLKVLSQNADSDGRQKVKEFTLHLLEQVNPDRKILDAIFKGYDGITDDDIVVYEYLLDKRADVEWFHFAGFLGDQRGNLAEYYDILRKSFESGVEVEKLYSFEKNSSDYEKFVELVEKEIESRQVVDKEDTPIEETPNTNTAAEEYIKHLVKENDTLNRRLDNAVNELNHIRDEKNDMMEQSISDKHTLMNCKLENERIKKESERTEIAHSILKRKYEVQSELVEQLSSINDVLLKEKSQLQAENKDLEIRYEKLLQECTMYTDTIHGLKIQINALQSQVLERKSSGDSNFGTFESIPIQELEEPEYGKDFVVEDSVNDSQISELEDMEIAGGYGEYEEAEVLDYNPEDLIEIKADKNSIRRHSNFFVNLVARHFEKKFANKSIAEQDNLIFIKLMENDYTQETVRAVKSAMRNKQNLLRLDLYKMVVNRADDEEVLQYCDMSA